MDDRQEFDAEEFDSEKCFVSFEHIPLITAEAIRERASQLRYLVETINWTFATDHATTGKPKILGFEDTGLPKEVTLEDFNKLQVHRNLYNFSLEELIQFARETADVAEDICRIVPIPNDEDEFAIP